jgi:parallel beta-helix repeat protein
MKTTTTLTFITILLTVSLLGLTTNSKPASATPAAILVALNYPTIQDAINHANPDDTILVAAGTYTETLVINKTLTLMGSGKNVTTIKGNNLKPVITIEANSALVSGFTIQNGSSGISLSGYNSSVISNNAIVFNKEFGIVIKDSANNLISNNVVFKNNYAGIWLNNSDTNRISNNTVTFHENVSLHNQGIWLEYSSNNIIDGNTISKNAWGVDIQFSSNNNILHHNNFIDNTEQAISIELSSNTWDNGAEGNYWSDYTGPDNNPPDGIGDVAYLIAEDNPEANQDRYPLMTPWAMVEDTSPPFTIDDYDGLWHGDDFIITLTAVDDISGLQATFYRINNTSTIYNANTDGQPFINTQSANNTLEYWSIDFAGNEETPHHIITSIKLDKTDPTGSITINNGDTYTTSAAVKLNLSANDNLSGVSKMRFSNNGNVWASWEPYTSSKNWSLPSGDGAKNVYVQFLDNATRRSPQYNDAIVLDTDAPTVWFITPSMDSEVRSSNVTVQWNGTDAGVGLAYYEVRLDQGSWINVTIEQSHTFNWVNDGSHTVDVRAVDKIEHSREVSVNFSVNTKPIPFPYLEVAALTTVLAVAVGITIYVLRNKKKSAGLRRKE